MANPIVVDSNLELGPANLYVSEKVRATLTTAMGSNKDLTYRARLAGAAGNLIRLTYISSGTGTSLSVAVDSTAINVTLATDGSGVITSTADNVKDIVNSSFSAFGLVYAVRAAGQTGSGVVTALSSTFLSGGSDTLTDRYLGGLGEQTALNISTAASPLTAHTTGNQPRDKVVSGGGFQIIIPFKEVTLENMALGFANAVLIEGTNGQKRLDFIIQGGTSLRRSRATRLVLKKIRDGAESSNPNDILTLFEVSPVDAQVTLAYSPTEQRVLQATFEAWPDGRGNLGSWGTLIL